MSVNGELIDNDEMIAHLRKVHRDGVVYGLESFPRSLRVVLKTGAWRRRFERKMNQVIEFDRFEHFVTAKPLRGLGATIRDVQNLVRDDAETKALLDEALQRPAHRHADVDIINIRPDGTSAAAAIRRLRKDRPDLYEQVTAGELSPHAAAIEAGFRRRTFTAYTQDPERTARALLRHLSAQDIALLIARLQEASGAH